MQQRIQKSWERIEELKVQTIVFPTFFSTTH